MGAWADAAGKAADAAGSAIKEGADETTNLWLKFKHERPALALALSVLPASGQLTAAAEYYDAMKRGDSVDGVLAAIQFMPLGGVVKGVKLAGEAATLAKGSTALARAAERTAGPSMRAQADAAALARQAEELATQANRSRIEGAIHSSSDVLNAADYMNNPSSAWAAAIQGGTK